MKLFSILMMFLVTSTFCVAQDFSLLNGKTSKFPVTLSQPDAPQVPVPAPSLPPEVPAPAPVTVGPLKVEVSTISVLLVKEAIVRETSTNQKAVFITGDVDKVEKGVIVKLSGSVSAPLLRAYKAPVFFPPMVLSTFDENSWFFTGTNGTYTIEILDFVNGKWNTEYVNVVLKDGPIITDPGDPGDYAAVTTLTTKLVTGLNDPVVASELFKEYETAYNKLNDQSLADMRKLMSEARRTAFINVKSRNVNWNPVLMEIDKAIGDIKTTAEFKKAMRAFVDGFKKAVGK